MSKRIIISGSVRKLNPLLSFVLSLFATGTGEIYSGSPQRGIALALIRAASALAVPYYSVINIRDSHLTGVMVSVLFFLFITVSSPLHAMYLAFKNKRIVLAGYSSAKFIIFFAVSSILVTSVSVTVFFSFFSIKRINKSYPPVVEQGDIAVIKKTGNASWNRGETVVLNNENSSLLRIIGLPEENVSYSKGRFSVDGTELSLSIFSENELKKLSLSDLNVISETSGRFRYPVIQNREKYSINMTLSRDEFFAAPDDRNSTESFLKIKNENIYGRMEGLLFSVKRSAILIKPFRINE